MIYQLDPIVIGLLASVVTEVCKLFPKVAENILLKSGVAIAVMIVGTYLFVPDVTLSAFGQVVLFAFASYKLLVQPIAVSAQLKTQ